MAIAFDASATANVSSGTTSLTWSHTCTGSNLVIAVGVWVDSTASDVVSGVTYNGVSLTRINTATIDTFRQYLYAGLSPATGAHNVVVSFTGTQSLICGSASYTGVSQTGLPDAQNTATAGVGSTSISCAVTTTADNCWLVGQYGNNGGTTTAGSNSYQRLTEASTNRCIYDTNADQTPAGSHSLNVNVASSPQNSILNIMSIAPATTPGIAFDASTDGGTGGSGDLTFSHTCTGTNLLLFVAILGANQASEPISGVTYNGVSMTKVGSIRRSSSPQYWQELYVLHNPATGAHNVVVGNGGSFVGAAAASYTGCAQTSTVDASSTTDSGSSTTSFTQSVTSVANNCWTIATVFNSDTTAKVAGLATIIRQKYIGEQCNLLDSNGAITPAGSTSLIDTGPSTVWNGVMASFAPYTTSATFIPHISFFS